MHELALLAQAVNQPRPQISAGVISSEQPLPTSYNDPLYVVEPWAPTVFRTINYWTATTDTPPAGAQCLLILVAKPNTRVAIVFPQT
jgi:hypothetical protein